MRVKTVDMAVLFELKGSLCFVVGIARRNREAARRGARGDDSFFDRGSGKDQPNARAIFTRLAVRCVVHLEYQNRARLDEFCLTWLENKRRFTGSPAYQ